MKRYRPSGLAAGVLVVSSVLGVVGSRVEPGEGAPPKGAARPAVQAGDQSRPTQLGPALAHLREEVRAGDEGSLVIANGIYRAAFSEDDGLVYTPRVGSTYEPRLTWRYRARAVVTGSGTRSLEPVQPRVSDAGDHMVDFVRPGIVERYEGERTGVEQIFVLSERPAGTGDVRIRGDVDFAGSSRATDGGLVFEAGGTVPPFTYGRPVAFDAAKRPIPVRTEMSGSRLDLVLDAEALARADWPVTIDPLLGVTTVENTENQTGMDIAYNWRRGEFLVVYDTEQTSNPDAKDIRLRRYYDYGDAVGPAVTIHAGDEAHIDRMPQIACDLHTDRCLVVWERDGTTFRTSALLLTGSGAVVGTPFRPGFGYVDGYDSTHERSPRVVARNFHEHTSSEAAFLVTWRENIINQFHYVQFARVSANGATLGEGHFASPASTEAADVSYDPNSDRFLIAWQHEDAGIRVRTVSSAGSLGAAITATDEPTASGPRVAYDWSSRRSLVTWRELSAAGDQIGARLLGGASPTPIGSPFQVLPASNSNVLATDVAAQNGTFVVAYRLFGAGDDVARVRRLSATGAMLADQLVETDYVIRGVATSQHQYLAEVHTNGSVARLGNMGRWAPSYVHGKGGDFDADGKSDLFVFRPSSGQFFVRPSSWPQNTPLPPQFTYELGGPGHIPALLDWDGDGLSDLAVFMTRLGRWTIRLSTTGLTEVIQLGRGGDIPVPGDYLNGDQDEIAVFRPSTGEWLIRRRGSSATTTVQWGAPGDQPVPADYDGDGKQELCVFRPNSGQWLTVELDLTGLQIVYHGQAGDTAFGGNFVGGPEVDRALFRNGTWHIADGASSAITQVSTGGRIPVTLDWDGDGRLDLAFFNESNGGWGITYGLMFIGYHAEYFGHTGDIPAGAR